MRRDVTDALAGQREIFRVRSRHDAAFVVMEYVRILQPVEQQPAIRLVAHEKYLASIRRFSVPDERAHLIEQFRAVQHAGRVVRRVYQHDFRALVEGVSQRVHVRQKVLVRRHNAARTAMVIRVEVILHEERREDDDFVTRVEQRLQHDIERAARAAGHHDVARAKVKSGLAAKLRRDRRPRLFVTGVRHIAVNARLWVVRNALEFGEELGWRLHHRIAQRQVEDILLAELPLELNALLEHPSNPRALLHKVPYFL